MLTVHSQHPDSSDEQLLARFRDSGNLDILGELYARYIHLVYGVSLKYLASREDAQDAVMHIFEKLVEEIPRHEISTFRSWLYVLTKNHCFMALRAAKSAAARQASLKSDPLFMESEEPLHPLDREDGSPEEALKECLERLKAEQQACVRLFYYERLCYREIAGKLELSEKKVKSLLQNGKRNLKICLEKKHVS